MRRIVGCSLAAVATLLVAGRAHAQAAPAESPVVTAPGPQEIWGNQPDGAGGQYVLYRQPRGGDGTWDVYLLRVGPNGWAAPVRVSDGVSNNQGGYVHRTPSGVGVTWIATGPDITRVRYQRFTPAGAPVLPTPGGGYQGNVEASVGSGEGAIIVVRKADAGAYQWFVQRLDERGNVAWTSTSLGPSDNRGPASLCQTPAGDAIAVVGGAQVVAYKFSATGAASWGAGGVGVTSSFGDKGSVSASCDANGGVAIGWLDARRGPTTRDAFVQHLDASGHAVMTANGVEVQHDAGQQYSGEIAVADDGANGAFAEVTQFLMAIVASSPIYTMSVVRVTSDSRIAFGGGTTGRVEPEQYSTRLPRVAPDGKGGVFVAWQAAPTRALSSTLDINCIGLRWMNGAGANAWGAAPVRVGRCGAGPAQTVWAVDDGTAAAVWTDSRAGYTDVYRASASTPGSRGKPIPPGPPVGTVVLASTPPTAAPFKPALPPGGLKPPTPGSNLPTPKLP